MSLDISPRTSRFVSTDVFTSGYRAVGKLTVTAQGIMGLINDPTRSSLDLHDARMARLLMPTKLVDHFEIVRMMKNQIHSLCVSRREDLGPHAIVRGGYLNVTEHSVRITTQVFEIEGNMELPGRFDFTTLMSDGSRDFIPVFNATLTAILFPNLRVEAAGILVNRKKVDIMALLSQRVKPEN